MDFLLNLDPFRNLDFSDRCMMERGFFAHDCGSTAILSTRAAKTGFSSVGRGAPTATTPPSVRVYRHSYTGTEEYGNQPHSKHHIPL